MIATAQTENLFAETWHFSSHRIKKMQAGGDDWLQSGLAYLRNAMPDGGKIRLGRDIAFLLLLNEAMAARIIETWMNADAAARNAMSELYIADLSVCFGIRPPRFFETLEVLVFNSFLVCFRNYTCQVSKT